MSWRFVTSALNDRVEAIADFTFHSLDASRALPIAPFSRRLTSDEQFYFDSAVYAMWSMKAISTLSITWCRALKSGDILSCAVISRTVLETFGALEFLRSRCFDVFQRDTESSAAVARLNKLQWGSKSPVPLPWGGVSHENAVHVMDMVRATGLMSDYDWLCEAAHPSFVARLYWLMMGKSADNWTNKKFAEFGNEQMEKLVGLMESLLGKSDETASQIIIRTTELFASRPKT